MKLIALALLAVAACGKSSAAPMPDVDLPKVVSGLRDAARATAAVTAAGVFVDGKRVLELTGGDVAAGDVDTAGTMIAKLRAVQPPALVIAFDKHTPYRTMWPVLVSLAHPGHPVKLLVNVAGMTAVEPAELGVDPPVTELLLRLGRDRKAQLRAGGDIIATVELDDVAMAMAVVNYQEAHPSVGTQLRIAPDPDLTAQDVAMTLDAMRDHFTHLVLVESGSL